MPIMRIYTGHILDAKTQTVVNTVNCVGVMGKGIAAEFKRHDPAMFKAYKRFCDHRNANHLVPGKLYLWTHSSPWWILNFPTKRHWRDPSALRDIEAGLQKFVDKYKAVGITSITFPALGCQNGGLSWSADVKPLMERYLNEVDIPVEIALQSNIRQ